MGKLIIASIVLLTVFAGQLACDLPPAASGDDSGTDADSGSDTGSSGDLCDNYPAADNAFKAGDVIRNYDLIDRDDDTLAICELVGGAAQLLFMSISATTCETCASEIGDLASLQAEYEGQIVVVEVMQDVDDWSQIASTPWAEQSGYLLSRTEPADLVETDYGSNQNFLGYPTTPLIDLQTMAVLDDDCWTASSWHECIDEHL